MSKSNNTFLTSFLRFFEQYRHLFGGLEASNANSSASGGDRLMLQSRVEPFTRETKATAASEDSSSDLWKLFDEDVSQNIRQIWRDLGLTINRLLHS